MRHKAKVRIVEIKSPPPPHKHIERRETYAKTMNAKNISVTFLTVIILVDESINYT